MEIRKTDLPGYMAEEIVHAPAHYQGEIECVDAMRAMMTREEFDAVCRAQVMRYVWRRGKKDDPLIEGGKAKWWATWLAGEDPRTGRAIDEGKSKTQDAQEWASVAQNLST